MRSLDEKAYVKALAVADNASHNRENSLDDVLQDGIKAYLSALPPVPEAPTPTDAQLPPDAMFCCNCQGHGWWFENDPLFARQSAYLASRSSAVPEAPEGAVACDGVWRSAFDRLADSCVEHFGHLPGDYDAIREDARIAAAKLASQVPEVWVIPGDDNAHDNGFVDAKCFRDGEFTRPLYAHPFPPSEGTSNRRDPNWNVDDELNKALAASPSQDAGRRGAVELLEQALNAMREPCTATDRADARLLISRALSGVPSSTPATEGTRAGETKANPKVIYLEMGDIEVDLGPTPPSEEDR